MKRNPKQAASNLYDCIPQTGPCPIGCNQCFFNRPGAFYVPIDQPHFPTLEDVGDGIVRVNCGNDSNNQREHVIASTARYPRRFFNTSIPRFDFPDPVVLTANPKEDDEARYAYPLRDGKEWKAPADNIMFVRLRTSAANLALVDNAICAWTAAQVPVVITMMAYYDTEPTVPEEVSAAVEGPCYEWRVRHINSYFCPTPAFIRFVLRRYRANRLVSYCGSLEGSYCRLCRNCETYYLQTIKRLKAE